MKKVCPKCGTKLERRSKMYAWHGVFMHGWVCTPCNSLWDLGDAFIRYVGKRAKKEKVIG